MASQHFGVVGVVIRHRKFGRHLLGALTVHIGNGDDARLRSLIVVLDVAAPVTAAANYADGELVHVLCQIIE